MKNEVESFGLKNIFHIIQGESYNLTGERNMAFMYINKWL
jgi:hypothetical protein